ncbi:MAG: hypothetical protein WC405_19870 [Syntrophales bacterium]
MSASQSRQCEQGGTRHNRQAGEDESHLKEQLQRIRHKLLVMSGKGVNLIFAGGMGQSALSLFAELGIKVNHRQPGSRAGGPGPRVPFRDLGQRPQRERPLSNRLQPDGDSHHPDINFPSRREGTGLVHLIRHGNPPLSPLSRQKERQA